MRVTPFAGLLSWLAGCVILASCGDSTSPEPLPAAQLDEVLAESMEAQTLGASGLAATGVSLAPSAGLPRGTCIWNEQFVGFDCPARTSGDTRITVSFQLLDASGNSLRAYDATKVAAIRTVSDVNGKSTFRSPLDGTTQTLTVVAHNDATLSGLLTATHVLNSLGTSSLTSTSSLGSFTIKSRQITKDLVLPPRRAANPYPLSGSITSEVFGTDGVTPTSMVTMTFNGTSTVALRITFGTTTRECTLNLDRPAIPASCFGP